MIGYIIKNEKYEIKLFCSWKIEWLEGLLKDMGIAYIHNEGGIWIAVDNTRSFLLISKEEMQDETKKEIINRIAVERLINLGYPIVGVFSCDGMIDEIIYQRGV